MKYLVIAKPRAGAPEIPSSLVQASQEYLNSLLANGSADCIYGFITGAGGVGILNADSHERMTEILLGQPEYAFLDWEVHALCDFNQSFDKILELSRKQKK
jgi:hypothetical protein